MYTIEDLKAGRVVLKNDNPNLAKKIMQQAFPEDVLTDGLSRYYTGCQGGTFWKASNYDFPNLPVQQASDFKSITSTYPKVMLVSTSHVNKSAIKRVVIQEVNDGYLAWKRARTLEEAKKSTEAVWWAYAQDIAEIPEYTMEELQAKIGHEFKIKK